MTRWGSRGTSVKILLLHLLLCLGIFYTLYYVTGSICHGALRLDTFDGLIPFEFRTEPSLSNPKYLGGLLAMELTYFTSSILFAALLKRWVWDYAVTVTLLHVLLTCLVMGQFPLVWQWWLALGSGLILMVCTGHLLTCSICPRSGSSISESD
nr:transmembrane protein 244 [Dromaius novaehollandiae]